MKAIPPLLTGILMVLCAIMRMLNRNAPEHHGETASGDRLRPFAEAMVPAGLLLQPASQGSVCFEGLTPSREVSWRLVQTAQLSAGKSGYAGPVPLLVGIDREGRVTGVMVLPHRESPTFVRGIDEPWFLSQFVGKTARDPLSIGDDLDGITFATITVEAICDGVRRSLALLDHGHQPLPAGPVTSGGHLMSWSCLAGAALLLLLRHRLSVRLGHVLCALLLGFVSPHFVSLLHLDLLLRTPSSILALPVTIRVFLLTALVFTLFQPRGYCRVWCPLGHAQEAIRPSSFNPAHGMAEGGTTDTASAPAPFSEAIGVAVQPGRLLLLLFFVGFLGGFRWSPGDLEAFSAVFIRSWSWFGWVVAVALLVGSLVERRFYCRRLCPLNPLFQDIETLRRSVRTMPGRREG